jgi:hypothetical protein
MKNTKFLVKVARGTHAAEYVQRIDRSPVRTTLKRSLALVMDKLTAEDVVNSLGNSRCTPGTRTRPGYRVAPPHDHRISARLLSLAILCDNSE